MLIYRICPKNELEQLFKDKNFNNIGKNFINNDKLNNHFYKDNIKYLHFFKNKEDILYLNNDKKRFICTYDIPIYLLFNQEKKGQYLDILNYQKIINVDEYALNIDNLFFDYLLKVEMIDKFLDIDDYLDGTFSNFKIVYQNEDFLNKYSAIVSNDKIKKIYNILMDSNIIEQINRNFNDLINLIPELNATIGFEHKHPHHHLDVWNHTLYALKLSNLDFDIRLSLLLHDIGKPFAYIEQDGVRHFPNHPEKSTLLSYQILTRLGFNKDYIKKICYLILNHDREITQSEILQDFNLTLSLYLIQKCDCLAHNPQKLTKRKEYLQNTKKLILKNNTTLG